MSKILLVEDDVNISQPLSDYLTESGFKPVVAGDLESARSLVGEADCLVCDWNLPDGEGIDLIKELRESGNPMPVIMLTARKDLIDKVIGLEIGADDYMIKPFEPRELLARIKVALRRQSGTVAENVSDQPMELSGISVSLGSREVRVDGILVELTKLEFDLLAFLFATPGRAFTRNEILDEVWGVDEFAETRAVDNHIFQLRKKLKRDIFKTVHGIGYKLCSPED